MNSRTGNMEDILTFERKIANDCDINNLIDDIFDISFIDDCNIINRNRVNSDKLINENGKALINLCQKNNVIIINGRTGSDREKGDVTFNCRNGSSTIDYCITSPGFIPHIQDFQVDIFDPNLSDKHSPIILTLNTKPKQNAIRQETISNETDITYEQIHSKWSGEKLPEFHVNFDQNKINDLCQASDTINLNGTTLLEINNVVNETVNVSITAGINTNLSKKTTNIGPKKVKKDKQTMVRQRMLSKKKAFYSAKKKDSKKKDEI